MKTTKPQCFTWLMKVSRKWRFNEVFLATIAESSFMYFLKVRSVKAPISPFEQHCCCHGKVFTVCQSSYCCDS